jgi:hypothetical protein
VPWVDARRSALNTNDLRGKLLRFHVEPDGSYTVPAGNLFAPGTPLTRSTTPMVASRRTATPCQQACGTS